MQRLPDLNYRVYEFDLRFVVKPYYTLAFLARRIKGEPKSERLYIGTAVRNRNDHYNPYEAMEIAFKRALYKIDVDAEAKAAALAFDRGYYTVSADLPKHAFASGGRPVFIIAG